MIRVKTTDGMRRLQHAASYALVGQNRHGHSVADLGSDPNSAQRPSNSSRAYPRIGLWPQFCGPPTRRIPVFAWWQVQRSGAGHCFPSRAHCEFVMTLIAGGAYPLRA